MEPGLIQALAEQGISVMLAGVVIYWYRADSKERIQESKQLAADERNDKLLMLGAFQDNTRALTELKGAIDRSRAESSRLVTP